jgi:hypothetical protein
MRRACGDLWLSVQGREVHSLTLLRVWAGRDALGRGPGPPLAAASDGVRLQSRVQLLDGQLGQYLIGARVC